ncbi:GNAT family N-acetyltransferase [Halobacillus salinarum]|uniref:GNAT family N-acetyltransferase n=1 Tax=Halobacillus salinarum TaxID=2932257 RepID=A0ABY4EFH6_9BACI|nr:GNAT family protein [Halobacillus salinarum]UOQ42823.1 GNAT family N-acetyltransferase [Halobacillus salinarum]
MGRKEGFPLKGERVYLCPFEVHDASSRLELQRDNREFFETYSMMRSEDYYTYEKQRELINQFAEEMKRDNEYHFGIFTSIDEKLVGTINLFQVIRGSLQSAFIGYFISKKHNGLGYATEAVKLIVDYSFNQLELHRIEAGVIPQNTASIRVLEKAGFHKEGISRKNVKINGRWEDHQVLALINPDD